MSLVLSTYELETFTGCPRGMVLDVFKCACKANESARVIDECLVQQFRKPLFLGSNPAIFAAQMYVIWLAVLIGVRRLSHRHSRSHDQVR